MKKILFLNLLILLLHTTQSAAGGMADLVQIQNLEIKNNTDYIIVVTPKPNDQRDSAFEGCKKFEIHGTYSLFQSLLNKKVTKEGHMRALEYLKKAFTDKKDVVLGYVGRWKPINIESKCIVESDALKIVEEDGKIMIFFEHDPI